MQVRNDLFAVVPLVSSTFPSAVGVDAAVASVSAVAPVSELAVSELAVSEIGAESVEPCVAETVAASAGTA